MNELLILIDELFEAVEDYSDYADDFFKAKYNIPERVEQLRARVTAVKADKAIVLNKQPICRACLLPLTIMAASKTAGLAGDYAAACAACGAFVQ